MLYKRYRFQILLGKDQGSELWVWIMWTVLIVGMIVIGSHSIGQLSAHDKYIHLVNGMVKQYEFGCEKQIEKQTYKYDSTGKRINK